MFRFGQDACYEFVKALKDQAEKLWFISNVYKTHDAEKLAQRLVDLTFADTVFFQNSGVEAWECGIKFIRKYFSTICQPQRYRVISFQGCFHGRTLAAISASKAASTAAPSQPSPHPKPRKWSRASAR